MVLILLLLILLLLLVIICALKILHHFYFIQKIKNKWLSWFITCIPILIIFLLFNIVNSIVIIIHFIIFSGIAKLIMLIKNKIHPKDFSFYFEGILAIILTIIYLSIGAYLDYHVFLFESLTILFFVYPFFHPHNISIKQQYLFQLFSISFLYVI